MKRELFQNITAIPYTSGDAIDRSGFLSAVIGANAASGAEVAVKVEHSDDGGTFVPVTDKLVFPEARTRDGVLTFRNGPLEAADEEGAADAGGVVNIEVDLAGLKNIVKFTVTGAEGALAVVLGDAVSQPV